MRSIALQAMLPAAAFCTVAMGGGATFQTIPDAISANDMSPDGRFVVGELPSLVEGEEVIYRTYRWDRLTDTMIVLPQPGFTAAAVSDDGSVIAGSIIDPDNNAETAAIWTLATNEWTSLGGLDTGGLCPSRSNSYELSADGSVVVGLAWVNGCQARGFRWSDATGMQELQELANGGNRASVVDATGSVIGGFAQGTSSRTPTVWSGDLSGVLLDPPNGDAVGEIHGMNDAGTILLGEWNGKATKWTNGLAVQTTIGAGSILPGWVGHPLDIANNGTIVGFDSLFGTRRAWIQVGGTGPLIELRTYVVSQGAEVPDTLALDVPQAITSDGTTIIGHTAFAGAWLLTIDTPPLCAADLDPVNGDGMVDGADLGSLLGEWGPCPGCRSDFNADGVVDGDDLGSLLGEWGPCPTVNGACCFGNGCAQLTAAECAAAGGEFLGTSVPCSPTVCVQNDHCADAVDITDRIGTGEWILADNSTATPGFGGGDPELPEGSPSCHWAGEWFAAHSTIWYRFEAPSLGIVSVTLCDQFEGYTTMNDSIVAIYGGQCGELTEIACNDDGCGDFIWWSNLQFVFDLTPGETYYLMIGNPGGWTGSVPGTFRFAINSP